MVSFSIAATSYVEWLFDDMYKNNPNLLVELSTSVKKDFSSMYDWYAKAYEQQNMTIQITPRLIVGALNLPRLIQQGIWEWMVLLTSIWLKTFHI